MRGLIRRDQDRQAQERLENLLLAGVKSGPASPLTKQDWAEVRTDVAKRPQGIRALSDIAVYLAEASFFSLAATPELGAARTYNGPAFVDVRMWRVAGFPNHLIFYRPIERGIEVIRVLHAKRDIESLFGGRG